MTDRSSAGVADAEEFGAVALGEAVLDGELAEAGTDALHHGVGVDVLAHVATQCPELALELSGDVDDGEILIAAHRTGLDPHLLNLPVLELGARQAGERKRVAGVGIHRTHRRLAGRGVVGMRAVGRGQVAQRRLGDDHLGTDLADDQADVVAQLHRDLDGSVHEPEEPKIGDADLGRRLGLLLTTDRCHLATRDRVVEPTGLAIGHEAVRHHDTRIGQGRNGARRSEVDVVGMRGDDQDSLDLGELQHSTSQGRIAAVLNSGDDPRVPAGTIRSPTVVAMTTIAPYDEVSLDDFDLSDPEFWLAPRSFREGAFKALRDTPGLVHYAEREIPELPFPPGPGYWAVTRHDDIWHVSRNPKLFCSGQGSNIGDLPQEMNEFFGSMINMDDPKHFRLRSIVSKGFTPKEITAVEDVVKAKANQIIDRLLADFPDETCDFVEHVAAALPLEIICDMMGIPADDYGKIFKWTNTILGGGDPDFVTSYEDLMGQSLEMFMYAQALGEDRKANPQDDITSVMMAAEVDGEQLTAQEFGSFFILLVVAGNETTRNAISHGMKAFTDFPDQRDLLYGNFDTYSKGAVEEIVRWGTPVIHFRRTATEDTELGGQAVKAGEKVVMWYNSGNRDERVFENPYAFDITREPNPAQIGFGAGGPHFCLGANLARREITVMFDTIRTRLPSLRITGEPAYLQSSFINGIKRLQCAWD
jgi:methyl-branched lipid omega-hydroxylase